MNARPVIIVLCRASFCTFLETAVRPQPFQATALWRRVQALDLTTPDEAKRFIREDRDAG